MPRINDERNPHPVFGQTEATVMAAVCNFNALLKAEKRARRRVGYKNSVSKFHMLAMTRCYELYLGLMDDSYRPQKGEVHEVYEPKRRTTVSSKYPDRVVQGSYVVNYFYPAVVPNLEPSNCACMKGRGVDYARERFKAMLRASEMDDFCVKADMKKYFQSIKHEKLYHEIERYIRDPWGMHFFRITVENASGDVGIDLGSEVYQLAAASFLDRMDKAFAGRRYVRYQDDLIVIGSKDECREFLAEIRTIAHDLGLALNEKKTFIQPIRRPIKFLGFSFLRHPTGRVTMKRLPEKIRHEKRKLRRMIKKGVPKERVARHYESVRACLKKGGRSGLHKMDKFYDSLRKEKENGSDQKRQDQPREKKAGSREDEG